ncbi:MAG: hypothetical protein ABJI00_10670, partial [Paracoccaceae bacterium]
GRVVGCYVSYILRADHEIAVSGSTGDSQSCCRTADFGAAAAKANFVPQTASSSNPRIRTCGVWRQSGLPPQHLGWPLDVGFGPFSSESQSGLPIRCCTCAG